jgi:hypothetical protein
MCSILEPTPDNHGPIGENTDPEIREVT